MDFARNTVELTSSRVTLGMEKRDSQGLRFLEWTNSHFPLRMALIINKGKWLLVAFLPL